MCGIAGLFSSSDNNNNININWIKHRGPDDSGVWRSIDQKVQLSHSRLSILDLSFAGHQPMITKDKRVVMVFNGEVYNFIELRSELKTRGVAFKSTSDSEVFLNLFALDGISCFRRLKGIFSAAFWERDKQILTVVRDPVGVKPLYYSNISGVFNFASEIKALIRSGSIEPKLNPSALLTYLGFLWSPGKDTLFKNIKKVLPGHFIQVKDGNIISDQPYRSLNFKKPLVNKSLEDTVSSVQGAVQSAVEAQLVSDAPLGAFLSGGLDSSAVVSFAQKLRNEPGAKNSKNLQCFSIEIESKSLASEGFADDLPYAKRVAKHLGVDLNIVRAKEDIMDRLPEMLYYMDEPCPDPAALNTLLITELARKEGIKVLLSGAGGDDIFTGYRRHYALIQERWWCNWPISVRKGLEKISRALPSYGPVMRRLNKAFRYASHDDNKRLVGYFLWTEPSTALNLLHPDIRNKVAHENIYQPMLESLSHLKSDESQINRMLYLECKHFLADHNLNYTDKMGMASGVEIRVPLLDLDLIDLVNSIPINMKQNGRIGKYILKKAMEPYLPHDVIYRPKTGFGVPLRHWLSNILEPLVEDTLSEKSISKRGILNFNAVNLLRQQDRAGKIDASYTIFSLVCLELWCRQYFDGFYPIDSVV